jgi:hypothetical protein
MRQRALLRNQVIRAWCRTIKRDYGKINSERSLQAAFWANLYSLFPKPKLRQILIEPRVNFDDECVYPDLVSAIPKL